MTQPIAKDLNHVGLVVPDVDKCCAFLEAIFGIKCSEPKNLCGHLKIRFAILKNAELEIIEPLIEDCDHARWLKDHPKGGIHHICFHTENLKASTEALEKAGVRPLDPRPLELLDGNAAQFFNPDDCFGILTELAEGGD